MWVKNMQIESAKHRELLLVPVSFFAHEKGGIYNRSETIMSIDKLYEPIDCYVILIHLQYKLYC